ncbi:MAG: ribosome maturation factor RimP [Tissierellia bacterium]|nr:ribosome maturation factor RimP [Tissierellia bacterium]
MSKELINSLKAEFNDDIEKMGFELVDIEFITESGEKFLRFYIYKDGGVSIDDCEEVSRFIDPRLDELDLIKTSYYLEVSSPDLNRPLKTDDDLRRNIGVLLDISLYRKIDNKKEYRGELIDYDPDYIILKVDDKEFKFDRKDVSKIVVAIVF